VGTLVAAPYPVHALDGCETALVLFAAAFGGAQDAAFVRDAGLHGTCVDKNLAGLEQGDYPTDWAFVEADVFRWAPAQLVAGNRWDVVSLDPFTNHFDHCGMLAPLWCALARRAVILGCAGGTVIDVPGGWRITGKHHRSSFNGGTYWAVLEEFGRETRRA
jgi:hypothetical protein